MHKKTDVQNQGQYDPQTLERLRGLIAAKNRAVEQEDHDEAKRCKDLIVRLKSVGAALAQLEEKKRIAVANEDFDTAKALKAEVDGVRALDNEREMHHHRRESSLMAGDTDADLERRAQKAHVYGDQVVASGTRGLYMDELNGRRCASQDGVEIECMVVTAHEGRLEIEGLVALYYARHGQSEWNEHYKW